MYQRKLLYKDQAMHNIGDLRISVRMWKLNTRGKNWKKDQGVCA